MRRSAKIDINQSEIVSKLRQIGCSVAVTSSLGKGFPDIVVGYRGVNHLFEIKNDKMPPSKRKLTAPEKNWMEAWKGSAYVVKNFEECLEILLR